MTRATTRWRKAWVLWRLYRVWCRYPTLRLGQLVALSAWGINDRFDPFYVEDGDLIAWCERWTP